MRRPAIRPTLFFLSLAAAILGTVPFAAAQEGSEIDADELRETAERILSQRAYAESPPGVFSRLLDWLAELFDIDLPSPESAVSDVDPAGLAGLRTLLIVLAILALVAWGATYIIRRRTALRIAATGSSKAKAEVSANDLDRRAAEAARRGEYAEALRLRFEAGLIRLERRGVLSDHATRTSGEVADAVHLAEFDRVAGTFDAVVYGRRPAAKADDDFSASAWPVIVARAPEEGGE